MEVTLSFVVVVVGAAANSCVERAARSGALCLVVKIDFVEIGHVLEKLVAQTVAWSLKTGYY